jgi:hypothetical protein
MTAKGKVAKLNLNNLLPLIYSVTLWFPETIISKCMKTEQQGFGREVLGLNVQVDFA